MRSAQDSVLNDAKVFTCRKLSFARITRKACQMEHPTRSTTHPICCVHLATTPRTAYMLAVCMECRMECNRMECIWSAIEWKVECRRMKSHWKYRIALLASFTSLVRCFILYWFIKQSNKDLLEFLNII